MFVMFPSLSLKHLKPQSNTINPHFPYYLLGIVAYGFVKQPFSKQLYAENAPLNVEHNLLEAYEITKCVITREYSL